MHLFDHLHTVNTYRRWVRRYCWKLGLAWQRLTHYSQRIANHGAVQQQLRMGRPAVNDGIQAAGSRRADKITQHIRPIIPQCR